MCGNVTEANVRRGEAPKSAAVSSKVESSSAHRGPTMRTMTATLKATCAHRIAGTWAFGSMALIPVATTTLGMRKGTVMSAVAVLLKRKPRRDVTHVKGSANATVRAVESVACHVVNHHTLRSDALVMVSARFSTRANLATMVRTGSAKNSARAANGSVCSRRAVVAIGCITTRWISTHQAMSRDSFRCLPASM